MVEKLTGKELVIKVLEDSDEPMSCSEICDTAIESKYFKLYARGTDNDQKKAQISSLLSTWCLNDNCPVTRYDKGHDGNSAYTYVLNENVEDEDNESDDEEEYCEECGEFIDDCECDNEKDEEYEKDEYGNEVRSWEKDDEFEDRYPLEKGTLFFWLCHDDDNSKILLYETKNRNKLINIEPKKSYHGLNLHIYKEYILNPGKYVIVVMRNNVEVLNKYANVYKNKRTSIYDLDYINFKGNVNGTGKLNVTSINKETGISINKDFIGRCPKSLNLKPGNYTIEFWNYSNNRKLKKLYKENSFTKHVDIYESKTTIIDENWNENVQRLEEVRERLRIEEQKKLDNLREDNRLRLLQEEKLKNEKIEKQKFVQKQEQERLISEEEENNERLQLESQSSISDCNILPVGRFNKYGNGHGNGNKKIITRARLPNGEVIKWTELLRRYNLYHNPGRDASGEWFAYKRKDTKGLLPDVDRIDADGNLVPYKPYRIVVGQTKKSEIWMTHFGNVLKTICPCCVNVYDREIRFPTCYELGHNEPHSKGGTEEFDNLIPICKECNDGMGHEYTVVEYRQILLGRKKLIE